MPTKVKVSNSYVASNPDYEVAGRFLDDNSIVQYAQLEISTTGTASPVTANNPLPVSTPLITSGFTEVNVTIGTSSVTILALNASRKGAFIQNVSDTDIWISETSVPTINSGFLLASYGTYEVKTTNLIRGISSVAGKTVRVASW